MKRGGCIIYAYIPCWVSCTTAAGSFVETATGVAPTAGILISAPCGSTSPLALVVVELPLTHALPGVEVVAVAVVVVVVAAAAAVTVALSKLLTFDVTAAVVDALPLPLLMLPPLLLLLLLFISVAI